MFALLGICIFAITLSLGQSEDPPGHMQPIGSHQAPLPIDEVITLPDPIEFYDEYVQPSKPVLFKGAAKKFPSFALWKDDEYLSKNYGTWRIQAEVGKKENRSLGTRNMSFRKFIKIYNETDIYLVEDVVPPNPMTKEVFLPKNLLCGGFTDFLNTAVMWFSSGGTKSVLHHDVYENINCLYDGSKEFFMIDQKLKDKVPIDVEDGGYSSVNVEKVDMHKYPTLSNITWHQAHMEEGDCMYIPSKWYHHVNSSESRNLAINIWWNPMYDLPSRESCGNILEKLPEHRALYYYKMSDPNESVRTYIFEVFDPVNRTVSREQFMDKMPDVMNEGGSEANKMMFQKELKKLFKILDKDKDDFITSKEVYDTPLHKITRYLGTELAEEKYDDEYVEEDQPRNRDEL